MTIETNISGSEIGPYDAIFVVSPGPEGWTVSGCGRKASHFATQERAIRWAAFSAQAAELKGNRATFRITESEIELAERAAA